MQTDQTAVIKELVYKGCKQPLMLALLNKLVKEHAVDLREAGAIVNSNIVIASACGIVLHENKALLPENVGPILLVYGRIDLFLHRNSFVKCKIIFKKRKTSLLHV